MDTDASVAAPALNPVEQIQGGERSPCGCKRKPGTPPRNLVLCFDGTLNQYSVNNINVIELYNLLDKDDDQVQLTYYSSGVGTHAKPSHKSFKYYQRRFSNFVNSAVAWSVEKEILDGYRWLVDNYGEGDCIYLFGFSRGAYQARALAGMIHKVGLVYKGNEEQIPFAFELYAHPSNEKSPLTKETHLYNEDDSQGDALPDEVSTNGAADGSRRLSRWSKVRPTTKQRTRPPPIATADLFKKAFSRKQVNIHFIGVWDTVSSVGIIRDKNLPGVETPEIACYFRHALALDERRVKFLPEFARGGLTVLDEGSAARTQKAASSSTQEKEKRFPNPRLKEVWFPGTHSDVGGGNTANPNLDRRHPALLWMVSQASTVGLRIRPLRIEDRKRDRSAPIHESLKGTWKLLEYLPIKHSTYKTQDAVARGAHLGQGRHIQPGQKIHASIAFYPVHYSPKAFLPSSTLLEWDDIVGKGNFSNPMWAKQCGHLLEMDILDSSEVEVCLQMFESPSRAPEDHENSKYGLYKLSNMIWSGEGRQKLRGFPRITQRLLADLTKCDVNDQVTIANIVFALCVPNESELNAVPKRLRDSGFVDEALQRCIFDEAGTRYKRKGIAKLLHEEYFRRKLQAIEPDLGSRLSRMLTERATTFERDCARWLIQVLAEYEDSRNLLQDSVIGPLIRDMEDTSKSNKREASLKTLDRLVKTGALGAEFRLKMIPELLKILNTEVDHDELQRTALQTLADICKPEALSHSDIFMNNMSQPIVQRAIDKIEVNGNPEFQELAEEIIVALCNGEQIRRELRISGLIDRLYGLLSSDQPHACQTAKPHNANVDDSRKALTQSNVMIIILDALSDEDREVVMQARNIALELMQHVDTRMTMLESRGKLCSMITDAVKDGTPSLREAAIKTARLIISDDAWRKEIAESTTLLQHISLALGDSKSEVEGAALEFVREAVKYPNTRARIEEEGIVEKMRQVARKRQRRDKNDAELTVFPGQWWWSTVYDVLSQNLLPQIWNNPVLVV